MASSTQPLARVGILSIGDMGAGIARLLVANGFAVFTNCKGRSQDTVDRARAAGVGLVASDTELADQCDIILSVVPPRDAVETAQRIVDALPGSSRRDGGPLYFADMNAVAPSTCRKMASMFSGCSAPVRFVDGSIIGRPPSPRPGQDEWYRPLMPTSGPHDLSAFPSLAGVLNSRHISADVGAASGLKMCYTSMFKGYSAIAVQAFTTAYRLGLLPDLEWALAQGAPERVRQTEGLLVDTPPKAYRWVREMEEIGDTFAAEGGFEPDLFRAAAAVFRTMAEDTVLGQEKMGRRKRGTTAQDVAAAVAEGLAAKRKKTE